MLEINALVIIGVPVEMRHLQNVIDRVERKSEPIGPDDRSNILIPHAKKLRVRFESHVDRARRRTRIMTEAA
jgi:hypothetical protein